MVGGGAGAAEESGGLKIVEVVKEGMASNAGEFRSFGREAGDRAVGLGTLEDGGRCLVGE